MNQTKTQEYIPGICNINHAEIAYRRKAMIFGFVLAAAVFIGLYLLDLNVWLRAAIVFVPLYIGVIGYFQVKNKFCVSYGASGKQNAADGDAMAHEVLEAESIAADKRKARKMNLQALVITLVILLVTILIP